MEWIKKSKNDINPGSLEWKLSQTNPNKLHGWNNMDQALELKEITDGLIAKLQKICWATTFKQNLIWNAFLEVCTTKPEWLVSMKIIDFDCHFRDH